MLYNTEITITYYNTIIVKVCLRTNAIHHRRNPAGSPWCVLFLVSPCGRSAPFKGTIGIHHRSPRHSIWRFCQSPCIYVFFNCPSSPIMTPWSSFGCWIRGFKSINIPFAIHHHYHLCLCVQPQTLLVKSQIVQSISNKPPIILQYLGDNACSKSFPWMSTPQCLWSKIHILIQQRHDYHPLLSISFGSMPYTYPRWNVIKMLKSAAQIHLIHTKPPCSSIMFLFL